MTLRQTYINAAKRVYMHKDNFSCLAINYYHIRSTKYAQVMGPEWGRKLAVRDVVL